MDNNQLKEYENVLDVQYELITKLNTLKEKRNALYNKMKEDKNIDSFDKEIFALELEAEILLSKMQENYEKIKALQAVMNNK